MIAKSYWEQEVSALWKEYIKTDNKQHALKSDYLNCDPVQKKLISRQITVLDKYKCVLDDRIKDVNFRINYIEKYVETDKEKK